MTPTPKCHYFADDSQWFRQNPNAIIRFRNILPGEYAAIENKGERPPEFVPSWIQTRTELQQTVVIDLNRLTGNRGTLAKIRIRIKTVHLRSRQLRERCADELIAVIADELGIDPNLGNRQNLAA